MEYLENRNVIIEQIISKNKESKPNEISRNKVIEEQFYDSIILGVFKQYENSKILTYIELEDELIPKQVKQVRIDLTNGNKLIDLSHHILHIEIKGGGEDKYNTYLNLVAYKEENSKICSEDIYINALDEDITSIKKKLGNLFKKLDEKIIKS